MKKIIFYLTKGSLNSIIERDSLWVAASNDTESEQENVTITIDNPRPLVQVTKVERFQYYPNTLIPRFVLELFDGETNLPVSIELNHQDNIISDEENISNLDIQKKIVRTGSILMIHRYRLIHSKKYFTEEELLVENIPNKILCIIDFSLIGYSEYIYKLSDRTIDDMSSHDFKTLEKNDKKLDVDYSHNICDLNPRFTKQQWSIKCRLMEKTLVREFENRQNGSKGRVMRLLLLDKTSQIEMVAFNEQCDNESLKNMKLKKYFIIKNGEIKIAKNNLKSWPDQVSLQFEILITSQTEIIEAKREESDSEEESLREDKDFETNKDEKKDSYNKYKAVLHQKFTVFNELVKKKCESLVDVIGIITEIGELKKIKKNELSLRNFKMVDKTKTIISFALWGKQAESFDSKIGSVLIINKAKITNFGGISLSVIRISEIIKINPNENNKIANDLYEWWRDKWWESRSNNQQIRKKRSIDNDESDEELNKQDSIKKRKS